MNDFPSLSVKVWGEYACFTRPEMKVERVSYEVMTPSAARGVLEAIFWKPEFRWKVHEIHVLKPIQFTSLLRNEVNSKASVRSARAWASEQNGGGFFAEDDRTQRHTLALRDVSYVIYADVEPIGRGKEEHPAKYRDQFRRRVSRGQCFHRPYLGCREFAAYFDEPDDDPPIEVSKSLGRVLFDVQFAPDSSGVGTPVFFNAELERGIVKIPQSLYNQTLSGGRV